MSKNNEIILLGTGCAVPSSSRCAPGTLLSYEDGLLILLDIGSGITKKIVENGRNVINLKYILITHFHVDHTSDLIYLIKANWMYQRENNNELIIIGPIGLKEFYKNLFKTYHYLSEKINFTKLIELKSNSKIIFNDHLKISGIKVPHSNYSMAYIIERDGFNIAYSGDTDYDENFIKFIRNSDILIHECSLIDTNKRPGHVTPSEIAKISSKINAKKIILTHFYPICDKYLEEIYKTIKNEFTGELILGRDNDIIFF
ncbi:MAG: MBL fold metallo-hydrolase [Candidatus Lokiarchaeota archaeon]|nr:MBL fold metallo-hydrolase [Candidatus Lokiarchaeota archaeon]